MKYLYLAITIVLISSCKTQNLLEDKSKPTEDEIAETKAYFGYKPDYQYHIRRDDKITISVWGQVDLSVGSTYGIYNSNEVYGKWLMVDANGNIEIPRIGTTNVKGMTDIELKTFLKKEFAKWIVNPIVDVKILNKDITILGEVKAPGIYDVDKDFNSLLEILARSGGFARFANMKHIKVFRQEGPNVRMVNIDLSKRGSFLAQNIQLHPSDVIVVPSRGYKEFDSRISNVIPITSTVTASAIFISAFGL